MALSLFNYGFNALPTVFFGARTIKFELRGVATFGTIIAKRGDNALTKISIDKHSGLINTLINYKNMNVTNIFNEMKALSSNQRTPAKKADLSDLNAKQRGESLESTNLGKISTDERLTGQSSSVDQKPSEALPSFQEDSLVFQQIEIPPNPAEIRGNIITTTLPPPTSNPPPFHSSQSYPGEESIFFFNWVLFNYN